MEAKNAYIDFKDGFDINSQKDWCEIVKNSVAMANSGGGIILIGAKDDGVPSGSDVTPVLDIDPAVLADTIATYTGERFSGFKIAEIDKEGVKIAALLIESVSIPMVFIKPGTYDINDESERNKGRQTVFESGAVYFRHGARSEPGDPGDMTKVVGRELEKLHRSWFSCIEKADKTPAMYVTQPAETMSDAARMPNQPEYGVAIPDRTYPHIQKEVVHHVNERLSGKKHITAHDTLCVRRIYRIDESKPQFYYKSKFASAQYSEEFVDWLVERYEEDPLFFEKTRAQYRAR
ncbi:MAG: putative DNA binding domain-containing protein [Euryarchaeota archaeon]|nr:putative DNA binding domain-containing protein [Euryarchaeota archaeon]